MSLDAVLALVLSATSVPRADRQLLLLHIQRALWLSIITVPSFNPAAGVSGHGLRGAILHVATTPDSRNRVCWGCGKQCSATGAPGRWLWPASWPFHASETGRLPPLLTTPYTHATCTACIKKHVDLIAYGAALRRYSLPSQGCLNMCEWKISPSSFSMLAPVDAVQAMSAHYRTKHTDASLDRHRRIACFNTVHVPYMRSINHHSHPPTGRPVIVQLARKIRLNPLSFLARNNSIARRVLQRGDPYVAVRVLDSIHYPPVPQPYNRSVLAMLPGPKTL